MTLTIKNCGLRDSLSIQASIDSGAGYLGFIHYPPSSRYIPVDNAAALCKPLANTVKRVAVVVNPDDALIDEILKADYATHIQLHGDELPQRVSEVSARTGLPVIKALGINDAGDLATCCRYADLVDALLLDTKSNEYGGTGHSFDWQLLKDFRPDIPWFLSGGLSAKNIEEAMQITGACMIDVSSGLERRKGQKDVKKITQFNANAQEAYERISR